MKQTSDKFTYSAINPNNIKQENKIDIEANYENKTFVINGIPIDAQQLAEFGMLCFSLASQTGIDDLSSCVELLDGFEIPVPQNELKNLASLI